MSFKSCGFTLEPHHLNCENLTAVNTILPMSVGSTEIPVKDYQKVSGSPNDVVQYYSKGVFFKFKP